MNLRSLLRYGLGALLLTQTAIAADIHIEDQRLLAEGLYRRQMYELAAREYAALLASGQPLEQKDKIVFNMAESLRRIEKRQDAERAYRMVMTQYPESPYRARAAFKRGVLLMEMEFYEGAAELFRVLLETEKSLPGDVRESILFYRADALLQTEHTEEALRSFDALLAEFPDSDYAPYARMKTAWILSKSEKAQDRKRGIELCRELIENPPSDRVGAEALFLTARMASSSGNHTLAAESYLRLLKDYPDDARAEEAFSPAAWSCYRAKRFSDALRLCAAALDRIEADNGVAEWLYLKANCERELMQPDPAVKTYARLLKEYPQSDYIDSARYEMALTYFKNARHEEALRVAENTLDMPDSLREGWLWLQAEAAAAIPDNPRAIESYRRLIHEFPDGDVAAQSMYRLAYHLQRLEDWEEASQYFLMLSDRHPLHELAPRALYSSGICMAQAGKAEQALRDWIAFLTRYPDNTIADEVLFQKASEEMRLKRGREALATLDTLLQRFPETKRRSEALLWRGSLLYETEDFAEAEKALRTVLAENPERTVRREAMFLMGIVLLQRGREEEAAAMFQPLLEEPIKDRFSPERLRWLSEYQFGREDWASAEKAARNLILSSDDPGWLEAGHTLLGRSLRAQNKREAAIDAFSRALSFKAHTRYVAEASLRLGQLLLAAGRGEEAEPHLRNAAAHASNAEGLQKIRALAYTSLGELAVRQDNPEAAVRFFLSVGLLFDDAELVPPAMLKAAEQLEQLGRSAEKSSILEELLQDYPESPEAAEARTMIADSTDARSEDSP